MNNRKYSKNEELLKKKIRTKENGKQTLALAENEISYICDNIGLLDSTSQVAMAIYKRSLDYKLIENRCIGTVAAASVYAACKVENEAKTIQEISSLSVDPISKRAKKSTIIKRTYSEISHQLELRTGPIEPENYVPELIEKLNLSEHIQHRAIELCNEMDGNMKSGKSPVSLAAAAVYVSTLLENELVTQVEISKAAGVSKKTIGVRYVEVLENYSDININ